MFAQELYHTMIIHHIIIHVLLIATTEDAAVILCGVGKNVPNIGKI